MKETYVLATGAGGSDLLKSLAIHGVGSLGMHFFSSNDLAQYVLMKSGITVTEGLISRTEENAYIVKALDGVGYFGKVTYHDVIQIAEAIRRMRSLTEDESSLKEILSQGIFQEKNKALYEVYSDYIELLHKDNVLDGISYLRLAFQHAGEIKDAEFMTLKEFPPTILEKAVLNRISGGNVKEISMQELFRAEDKPITIQSIRNCYGAANEVEQILTDIYRDKKADKCTVVMTDPATYAQLFYEYSMLYKIPVTFGCGVPVTNGNPAKLVVLYYNWITSGFFGADALLGMFDSPAFDKDRLYENLGIGEDFHLFTFRDIIGSIRFTDNVEVNTERLKEYMQSVLEEKALLSPESKDYKRILKKESCFPALEKLAAELALPVEEFIVKYAKIRLYADDMVRAVDYSANDAIYNELKAISASGVNQTKDDIIRYVLEKGVCAESMEGGALHVTTLEKAFSALRDNIYICGLSAPKFPGSPKENYLLLDADLKAFGEGADAYTSDGKVLERKDLMLALVRLAAGLGCNLNLSYAGLNVSELKKENASSVIFEILSEEKKNNRKVEDSNKKTGTEELKERIETVGYFEPQISLTREIGNYYNSDFTILNSPKDIPDSVEESTESENTASEEKDVLPGKYSPSAINLYFSCPRRFMLNYVMGIPEVSETDPFEVISAADKGTLAHSLFELLANSGMTKDEFLKISGEFFDRYLKQNPPLIAINAENEKQKFLEMMEKGYDMDPHRKVVLAEEDIECIHEVGVIIHGFPDRVEQLSDGTYLIVDYKTGRNKEHNEDDPQTCLQVLIYAYLMEHRQKNPVTVSGGEFRYITLGESVTCKYDDETKEGLKNLLKDFKSGIESGEYPLPDFQMTDKDPCKYCKYGAICGKQ